MKTIIRMTAVRSKRALFNILLGTIMVFCFGRCEQNPSDQKPIPIELECEYLKDPLGIGTGTPRLSWKLRSYSTRGISQTAYRILVAENEEALDTDDGDLWDSGKVNDDVSSPVQYAGKPADSRKKLYWKVRIWDQQDQASSWSAVSSWETALLERSDWRARWIGKQHDVSPVLAQTNPAPYFRKMFSLNDPIRKARIYVSGLGYYEMLINGKKADDRVLAPAPSNYDRRSLKDLLYFYDDQSTTRVYYNTYDATSMLKTGPNTIGMVLGNGWYNQRDRIVEGKMWYDTPRLILQLEIEYVNGKSETICSDDTWKVTTGPVVHDGIFTGEIYDARKELGAWTSTDFDDSEWEQAILVRPPTGHLVAQTAPPDRIIRTIQPVSIEKNEQSHIKIDVGQMISGWASVRMKGTKGNRVSLRFIEEMGRDYGQQDGYIFNGKGPVVFEPKFTWHAFRHIEIEGLEGTLTDDDVNIRIVHTDVDTVGHFECSNPLFNNINENYIRTQLGNFHGSFSSDCPHRERLGYTGDGQVITESTIYSFDMRQFYLKWLDDIDDARNKRTGYVPHTAPFGGGGGGPAWGSAYVIIPWLYYIYYADTAVIRQHYTGMKQWVSYLGTRTDGDHIVVREEPNGWCLGDWATPDKIELPPPLVNTAYYYYVTDIMRQVARILGEEEDQNRFAALRTKIKAAFNHRFFNTDTGNYWEGRQGANIFPLAFGMVPEGHETQVLKSLVKHLEDIGEHFDTGILATPLLLEALTEHGHVDLAYRIMDQKDYPGFGHYIDGLEATTIWENWNGKSSHSHPMFGSVVRWFYGYLAGIRPDIGRPGLKHFVLKPVFPVGLEYVNCRYESIYGLIGSDWNWRDQDLTWDILVPPNTSADVFIPADSENRITVDGAPIQQCSTAILINRLDAHVVYNFGSGAYHIRSVNLRE